MSTLAQQMFPGAPPEVATRAYSLAIDPPSEEAASTALLAGWGGGAHAIAGPILPNGVTYVEAAVLVNAPASGSAPVEQALFQRHALVTQAGGTPSIANDPLTLDKDNAASAARAVGSITMPAAGLLADGDTVHLADPNSATDYKIDKTGLFFDDGATLIAISGKAKGSISCPAASALMNGNGFTIDNGTTALSFKYDVNGLGLPSITNGPQAGLVLLSGKAQGALMFPSPEGFPDGTTLTIADGVHAETVFEFRASVVGLTLGNVWVSTLGAALPVDLATSFQVAASALPTSTLNITIQIGENGFAFLRNNALGVAGNIPITTSAGGPSILLGMAYGAASAYTTSAQVAERTVFWAHENEVILGSSLGITATAYGTGKVGFTNNVVGIAGNVAISAVTGVTLLQGMSGGEAAATTLASGIAAKLNSAINADATIDIASTPTGAALALLADAAGYTGDQPITTTNAAIVVDGMKLGSAKMTAAFAVVDGRVALQLDALPPSALTIASVVRTLSAPTP